LFLSVNIQVCPSTSCFSIKEVIRNLVKRLEGLALFLLGNGHAGRTKGTDDMLRLTMKKWVILFCLISPTAFSFSEEIYRWTDDKGSVHFTDDVSNIPAPYLNQVHKREMTRGISNETQEQTDSGPTSTMPAEKTKQLVKQEKRPDRVMEYLNTRDKKLEEKRTIEKRISNLEEEMKATEELIKKVEKEEQDNHPSVQPFRSKYGPVPMKTPHYREKMKLANEIKAIKEEIATLERRLFEIKKGL
jgi:hypothetical protein